MEKLNLFSLCEDVLLEIFKFLTKKDMENLSITSKSGFQATKFFFETKTKLIFSKQLSFQELNIVPRFIRNYKDIMLVADNNYYYPFLIKQLNYLKIQINSLKFISRCYDLEEIQTQITNIRREVRSIKKVFIKIPNQILKSSEDVNELKNQGFRTNGIISIGINLQKFFENDFYKCFQVHFINIEELVIDMDYFPKISTQFDNVIFKVKKIKLVIQMSGKSKLENVNLLKIFQGVEHLDIIIKDSCCFDFLVDILEIFKRSLKKLELYFVCSYDQNFILPYKIKTFSIHSDSDLFIDNMLNEQNELEHLELGVAYSSGLLSQLERHGAPNLNVSQCFYSVYYSPEDLGRDIPSLPNVKSLIVNYAHAIHFIQQTKNLEYLKIQGFFSPNKEEHNFQILNNLELKYLKEIDLACVEHLFADIKLNLPILDKLICKYNLKLIKNYPQIKSLTTFECDFEEVLTLVNSLPNLEDLSVEFEFKDFLKIYNYFKNITFRGNLKFVQLKTRANSKQELEVLRSLNIQGDKIFSNFKDGDSIHVADILIYISIAKNDFMYIFKGLL